MLDLRDNLIETINPLELRFPFTRLESILLNGNPLICGAKFNSIKRLSIIRDASTLTCISLLDSEIRKQKVISKKMFPLCDIPLERIYELWDGHCSPRRYYFNIINRNIQRPKILDNPQDESNGFRKRMNLEEHVNT